MNCTYQQPTRSSSSIQQVSTYSGISLLLLAWRLSLSSVSSRIFCTRCSCGLDSIWGPFAYIYCWRLAKHMKSSHAAPSLFCPFAHRGLLWLLMGGLMDGWMDGFHLSLTSSLLSLLLLCFFLFFRSASLSTSSLLLRYAARNGGYDNRAKLS